MAEEAKRAKATRSHTTDPKLKAPPTAFKSGAEWTGNRAGRPKGSRNKLGEDFLQALQESFNLHGASTIETVRIERPHEYLKVVASILPKELNVTTTRVEEMSDDELADGIAALQAILAAQAASEGSDPKARH